MKKVLLTAIALSLVSSAAFASTRTVDGVGGASTFATIREALADLGTNTTDNGDGTKDVITVTANFVSDGFQVNLGSADMAPDDRPDPETDTVYKPLLDEVEIDLGGHVVQFAKGGDTPSVGTSMGDAIEINIGADAVFTLTNGTLIPAASVGALGDDPIICYDATASSAVDGNSTLNFTDLVITANDGSGNPLDPKTAAPEFGVNGAALPVGTVKWLVASGNGVISFFSNEVGDTWVINMDNVVAGFGERTAVMCYQDDPDTQFNMTNCYFSSLLKGLGFSTGAGTYDVDDCVFTNMQERGLHLGSLAAGSSFDFDGVEVSNCSLEGALFGTSNIVLVNDLSNNVFLNNGSYGLDLYAIDVDGTGAVNTITNCLFAGNGGDVTNASALDNAGTSANVRAEPIGASGYSLTFDSCTFHDYALDASATADGQIAVSWSGAVDLDIQLVDCVVSGSSTDTVAVIGESGETAPTGTTVTVSSSAVVTAGTYAMAGLGAATDGGGIISADPEYKNVNIPLDADSFVVTGAGYAAAASGGAALGGFRPYESTVADWVLY